MVTRHGQYEEPSVSVVVKIMPLEPAPVWLYPLGHHSVLILLLLV